MHQLDWLENSNLMSLCISMKKTIFQVLTNKRRTQKGPCIHWELVYSAGQEIQGCSAWLRARARHLLSLGIFLTARENRVFCLAPPCSSKEPQSHFSFDKNKLPKIFQTALSICSFQCCMKEDLSPSLDFGLSSCKQE